jgi:predicted enzyme related to lactoylglutathione lyase
MTVADVSSATRKAEELGGKVIVPPTMLPEGDEMAILLDPEGMSFAVWKSGTAPNNH